MAAPFFVSGRVGRLPPAVEAHVHLLDGGEAFLDRVESLVAAMLGDAGVRLPGTRRAALEAGAAAEGIEVPAPLLARLHGLSGDA